MLIDRAPLRLAWVFAGVFPLLLFGVVMLVAFIRQQEDVVERPLLSAAAGAAHAVDRTIGEHMGVLMGLSTSRALDRGDLSAFREQADRIWKLFPQWRTLILTDTRQPIVNLRLPPGKPIPKLKDPGSLARVLETPQPSVGNLSYNHVALRAPVVRNGRVVYTIAVPVKPGFLKDTLAAYGLPDAWSALIVGSDHVVIAAMDGSPFHQGDALPRAYQALPRHRITRVESRYAVSAPAGKGIWHVLILAPAAALNKPLARTRRVAYAGGILAAGMSVALVFLLSAAWSAGREAARLRLEIREREEAEAALNKSEQRRRLAEIAAQSGTWEWDLETGENFWSDGLWKLFDRAPGSCIPSYATWRETIRAEDRPRIEEIVRKAFQRGERLVFEWPLETRDGTVRWLSSRSEPIRDDTGRVVRYLGVVMDVTEHKEIDEMLATERNRLRVSLAEKTALLKEVHHRVKNNLQIVASLLNLQASRLALPEAVSALRETGDRVRSMALLHELLYRSENLEQIDLGTYIRELGTQLKQAYGPGASRIRLDLAAAPVALPLEQALPCGLIISELIVNALKHAFPGERPGRIDLELTREEDRHISVRVQDDGVGLPDGFRLEESGTLGLKLISNLATQLGGEIAVASGGVGGTAFRITFPLPDAASHGEPS